MIKEFNPLANLEKTFSGLLTFSWMIFISFLAIAGFYFGGGALLLVLIEKGIDYSVILLTFTLASYLGKLLITVFVIYSIIIFLNYLLPKLKGRKR